MKKILLWGIVFLICIASTYAYDSFSDLVGDARYCKDITITAPANKALNYTWVKVNLTDLNFTSVDELRLIDEACEVRTGEERVMFNVTNKTTANDVEIVFVYNQSLLKGTSDVYSIYYNSSNTTAIYDTDLLFYDTFDRTNGTIGNGWTTERDAKITNNQLHKGLGGSATVYRMLNLTPGGATDYNYCMVSRLNLTGYVGMAFEVRIDADTQPTAELNNLQLDASDNEDPALIKSYTGGGYQNHITPQSEQGIWIGGKICINDDSTYNVDVSYNHTLGDYVFSSNDMAVENDTAIDHIGYLFGTTEYSGADEMYISRNMDAMIYYTYPTITLGEEIETLEDLNFTVLYNPNVSESEDNRFTITFNNISNLSINANLVFANLIYNNTAYAMTKTTPGDYVNFTTLLNIPQIESVLGNIPFYFNFTLDGVRKYNTSTYYLPVSQIYVGSCGSTSNTTTLNLTFRDEITLERLNSNFDAHFKVWKDDENSYKNFVFNATSTDTYGFCFSPNTSILYSDITIQYTSGGYTTRDWIRNNYSLSNIVKFETLYLLSTTNSTAITMHVTDATDNAMPNILIETWYFDIATGNYSLVETKTTNTEGETIFNLILATNYYKFRFYQDNDLKKETDKFQITATDLYFQIVEAEATKLARWLDINTISTTLSYSNSSRGLTYSWLVFPGSVSSICWNITTSNGTSFNSDCSITGNSQFTYTLPSINESFFIKGYVVDVDDDSWTLDTLTIDLREAWRRIWGTEGMMLAYLVYIVISLAALSSPISGIIGAVFAFPLLFWFGLIPIGGMAVMGILFLAVLLISVMMRRQRG